jgi:nitronate monooxygenase
MSAVWKTKLTQSFPCRLPLVGAPMAGVSGGLLAAETCRAGALGFLAAGYLTDLKAVEEQIAIFREATKDNPSEAPLCLGFLGFAAMSSPQGWERYETLLKVHRPVVVQFFAPSICTTADGKGTNVDLAHQYGAKFLAQIGNVGELDSALQAGVDGIIAQGSEAGGHGLRPGLGSGTLPLVSKISSLTDLPVVAAGGIVNGKGVAAALALCDGAVLGTRLWASHESIGRPELQRRLVDTKSPDDVIRSTVFDAIENHFLMTPWPAPYDSVGTLRNETSDAWDGRPSELEAKFREDSSLVHQYAEAQKRGDTAIVKVLAGEGVGEIDSIEPAYEIIRKVEAETRHALQRLSQLVDDSS